MHENWTNPLRREGMTDLFSLSLHNTIYRIRHGAKKSIYHYLQRLTLLVITKRRHQSNAHQSPKPPNARSKKQISPVHPRRPNIANKTNVIRREDLELLKKDQVVIASRSRRKKSIVCENSYVPRFSILVVVCCDKVAATAVQNSVAHRSYGVLHKPTDAEPVLALPLRC